MMKHPLVLPLILSTLLVGCTTIKTPQPINGSKSDGTITMAYETGLFERAQVDWSYGAQMAQKRCQAWGYKSAQAFGGQQTTCIDRSHDGTCYKDQTKMVFQCMN